MPTTITINNFAKLKEYVTLTLQSANSLSNLKESLKQLTRTTELYEAGVETGTLPLIIEHKIDYSSQVVKKRSEK